jgi:predicted MPP superfamily phosphohydrolase
MWMFFLVFLLLYGAMNSYLLWKVWAAFPGLGHLRLGIAAFLLLMVLAPIAVHQLDRAGHAGAARACAAVGYTWLAVVLWFFVLALAADAWCLLVRLACAAGAPLRVLLPSPQATVVAVGVLVVLGLAWGLVEAQCVYLHRITVTVPGLPRGLEGVTIAQISDLHLGASTGRGRLDKTLRLIEQAHPDVLVATGDLPDSRLENIRPLAEAMRGVSAPLGKFAVLGNHEFYIGLDNSLPFLELAGFRVLRRQAVTVGAGLRIAGVDDPAGRYAGGPDLTDEQAVLPAEKTAPTILLKHQPAVRESSLGRFDLQLSGHTHGGQILPWHVVTRLVYRHYRGWYDLPGGAVLYATTGSGTWGPPVRLLARPEVALFTLTAGKGNRNGEERE